MAGPELQELLARLLSERQLLSRFAADPDLIASELAQGDAALAARLAALDPAGLAGQAELLLSKRRHETARIASSSWRQLGQRARALFDDYAGAAVWPMGHRRHALDALAFLRWLRSNSHVCDLLELLRLETRLGNRKWRLVLLRRQRPLNPPALYLAWRTSKGWQERLLSLGTWRGQ